MKGSRLTAVALMMGLAGSAFAAEFKPAVVYDTAGKHDKSFNEAVYRNGVLSFEKDTGIDVREFEPQNEAQREQGLARLAKRGYQPIVAVGFNMASAVEKVAKQYPDIKFTLIDSVVELPNVQSIVFKEHEGSFLVGALAAMKSDSGKLGFVGGMDIPLISAFGCGFEQGAKYINNDAQVFHNMTGSTPSAFADPARGSELAKSQFTKGADVVFAAAGGTGMGVYQAAKDEGKLAIGVDSNQNHLQPGTMLTSMVKRVGVASYGTWQEAQAGNWQGGVKVLGLAEKGVDWALDTNNQPLVDAKMQAQLEQISSAIIAGDIQVHDYRASMSCSY